MVTAGEEVPDPNTEDALLLIGAVGDELAVVASFEEFELRNNPDQQRQFRDGRTGGSSCRRS